MIAIDTRPADEAYIDEVNKGLMAQGVIELPYSRNGPELDGTSADVIEELISMRHGDFAEICAKSDEFVANLYGGEAP